MDAGQRSRRWASHGYCCVCKEYQATGSESGVDSPRDLFNARGFSPSRTHEPGVVRKKFPALSFLVKEDRSQTWIVPEASTGETRNLYMHRLVLVSPRRTPPC